MSEKDYILNEQDAIVYLGKHFGIHTNRIHKLIRDNVFYQKDPLLIIQNMETADYFYEEYLRQKHAKIKRKSVPVDRRPTGYPFTITESNGQKITFNFKKDVHAYLGRRYQRKPVTIRYYIVYQLIFWTENEKEIVQDIKRADAYFFSYLRHKLTLSKEEIQRRKVIHTNNRPAYDGGYHMQSNEKTASVDVAVQPQSQLVKKQFPYQNVAPLKKLPPFRISLSYQFKDDLERYDIQREAIAYLAEAFSLKARTLEKHFLRNVYSSDDPIVMAQDLEGTYQEYLDYLYESKEGARRKLINQGKPEAPKTVSSLSSTITELQEQQIYKQHQISDTRKTIERLQSELEKAEEEVIVLLDTIEALTNAEKILNK